ncbi:zinc-binding dehydrogenase [Streptomyces sp. PT12]|uniref:zinc-binding dehydrogenase n=1 Tax=Streptomyces sp. PT12 TaxID=1510197 RepID=UPI0026813929|nr:zinc-binding dehydrogenase [Streptomyces sp. PT12]
MHAAAGGVGHLAVQIAKARGARVSGTASAAKHDDPAVADEAAEQGLRTTAFMVEPDHAGLVELARLAESGALTAEFADVLPLAEAPKAHRLLESHHTTGKVVLTP